MSGYPQARLHLSRRAESKTEASRVVQGKGGLLLPGFVEPHIHLEKAYLLDSMDREAESLQDAIRITSKLKSSFTRRTCTGARWLSFEKPSGMV